MNKRANFQLGIGTVIVIFTMLALLYIILGTRDIGIKVSCDEYKPIGFDLTRTQGMNIAPLPPLCFFSVEVQFEDQIICSTEQFPIISSEGVVPCKNLSLYEEGISVNLIYTAYDAEKNIKVKNRQKTMIYDLN